MRYATVRGVKVFTGEDEKEGKMTVAATRKGFVRTWVSFIKVSVHHNNS